MMTTSSPRLYDGNGSAVLTVHVTRMVNVHEDHLPSGSQRLPGSSVIWPQLLPPSPATYDFDIGHYFDSPEITIDAASVDLERILTLTVYKSKIYSEADQPRPSNAPVPPLLAPRG